MKIGGSIMAPRKSKKDLLDEMKKAVPEETEQGNVLDVEELTDTDLATVAGGCKCECGTASTCGGGGGGGGLEEF
jgi:hypothetical protein